MEGTAAASGLWGAEGGGRVHSEQVPKGHVLLSSSLSCGLSVVIFPLEMRQPRVREVKQSSKVVQRGMARGP